MTADQSSGPAQAEPGKTAIRAAESELEFILSGLLTLLVGGTLYYVYSLFEALAPPWRLNLWAAGTGFVTVLMLATPLAYFAFRPGAEAIERYWSPFGKLVAVLFDLSVASSVWLLLPYASEPLRLLMVLFYSAAISGQVISTAESIWTNLFAVVSIFGSAALFFLQSETAYAVSLAVFLMAFGGLLLVVALILKQAIRSAIESRMEAERVSKELAVALADAQAARDARTRFIATASHDLRQPLQAAMLFFEQVTRQADPQRRDRAIAGVRNGFAEANAMLERMMEHLRIESGAVSVQREAVALGPLFAALADELQPGARVRRSGLRCLQSGPTGGAARQRHGPWPVDRPRRQCQKDCTASDGPARRVVCGHAPPSQTRQSVPVFPLIARGDPPRGNDVCPFPAVAAERRGPAVRARHRHLP
ncbi:histidine kinase dimerization/phospho-acceptor domain-containing protein [Novosphingobium sp.]|uniref:sensor histidine kinase n=1 Tax=Novosphingobium sp. TaxID=1874826 RepID=UPI0025F1BAA4|nr:histidine kinase dimerization/phospho-acceptor domain-containing protein [Novosphingobium sp.]